MRSVSIKRSWTILLVACVALFVLLTVPARCQSVAVEDRTEGDDEREQAPLSITQQPEDDPVGKEEDSNDVPEPEEQAEQANWDETPSEPAMAELPSEPVMEETPYEPAVAHDPEPEPEESAAAHNDDHKEAPSMAVTTSDDCRYDYRKRKCVPEDQCRYKYQFLDTTFSESCRPRNPVAKSHHVAAGLQLPPLGVVAGALGLFALDIGLITMTPLLKMQPLLFNVLQGFLLFVSGDALFQVIEQGWQKRVGVKFWRMFRNGLIGSLNNGLVHYSYYKWIDTRFPYHLFTEKRWGPKDGTLYKIAVANAKYWLEWPTIGVYKIASSILLTSLLGGSLKGVGDKFKKKFWLTQLRSLQVWPIYDTLLYAYVPTDHRPLFNSFMSILWGGYLSHISQPEEKNVETLAEATQKTMAD